MSSKTVFQYRLYCVTEAKTVTSWDTVTPTVCPNNSSHTIDTNSITIINSVSNNETIIKQDSFKTNDNYQLYSFSITAASGATGTYDVTFPYTISLLKGYSDINPTGQAGDVFNGVVNPDQTIGVITSDIASTGTNVNVNGTVIGNSFVGQYISLTDGVNTSSYSRINTVGDTSITLDNAVGFDFAAATPTYVKQRTYVMKDVVISENTNKISIDRGKIGGGILDAGRTIRLYYSNNGPISKTVRIYLEVLY